MKINPKFLNKELYEKVFKEVNKKFKGRPSLYRSASAVKIYKERGGKVQESKSSGGISRWFKEKWVNLTPFAEGLAKKTDFPCGKKHPKQKGESVCRPAKESIKYTKEQIKKAVRIKNRGGVIRWKEL